MYQMFASSYSLLFLMIEIILTLLMLKLFYKKVELHVWLGIPSPIGGHHPPLKSIILKFPDIKLTAMSCFEL